MCALIYGDYLDPKIQEKIKPNSIDLVMFDGCYEKTAAPWDVKPDLPSTWKWMKRVSKPTAAVLMFGEGIFSAEVVLSNKSDYKLDYIWYKHKAANYMNTKFHPLKVHENIHVFRNGVVYNPHMMIGTRNNSIGSSAGKVQETTVFGSHVHVESDEIYGKYPETILNFPVLRKEMGLHPTQKPIALIEFLIKTYTNPGDTVLDPCCGSGTTAIACLRTNRRYICIEKEEPFYRTTLKRVSKELEGYHQKGLFDAR